MYTVGGTGRLYTHRAVTIERAQKRGPFLRVSPSLYPVNSSFFLALEGANVSTTRATGRELTPYDSANTRPQSTQRPHGQTLHSMRT